MMLFSPNEQPDMQNLVKEQHADVADKTGYEMTATQQWKICFSLSSSFFLFFRRDALEEQFGNGRWYPVLSPNGAASADPTGSSASTATMSVYSPIYFHAKMISCVKCHHDISFFSSAYVSCSRQAYKLSGKHDKG